MPNPVGRALPAALSAFTTTQVQGAAPFPARPATPPAGPGVGNPGAQTPGGLSPVVAGPGGQTPGNAGPGGQTPDSAVPGGQTPGGLAPGNVAPSAQTPGRLTPAITGPGGQPPGNAGSQTPGGASAGGAVSAGATPSGLMPTGQSPGGVVPVGTTPGKSVIPGTGGTPGVLIPGNGGIPGSVIPGTGSTPTSPQGPRLGATTAYPPGAGPWSAPPRASTEPIGEIPAIGGPKAPGQPWPGDPVQVNPFSSVRGTSFVPPVGPRPAVPVDGMDPSDDAVLLEMRRLLSNSISLAGGTEEVAGRLRAALVQAQPGLFARLPGSPAVQAEQLAQALTWLVHNLDQPPLMVAGCGRLGAALAECGVLPQQLQLAGAALAEAMRAGMAANGWRQDFDQAWRSTWQHAYEWIAHGMAAPGYQPTFWTAVVVGHERRRDDLAVLWLRPYLPMPYRPGQYARIEVPEVPGVWRPYSLSGSPWRDNIVELHVRAKTYEGVSGTLVYRTGIGDTVRISRAEGQMGLPDSGRDLLMIAGDTGVVPLKALLTELAATSDPRSAVLFWGVRSLAELYDAEDIAEIARSARRATVIPVISEGEAGPYASGLVTDAVAAYGEWSEHEVYLAGPPLMLAATSDALQQLGVDPERIHYDRPE